jgi:thiol-disulfide isomerase/thioredoxin
MDLATAPSFSEPHIKGKGKVSLSQYSNTVILLNFWATWCPPCRFEIPDLIKLQNQYSNGFIIIGASVDEEGVDTVIEFYDQIGINYPVIMATAAMIRDYGGISAIPTSFVIDTNGKIIKTLIGYRKFKEYEAEITPYLPKN